MGGPSASLAAAIDALAADRGIDVDVHEAAPASLTVPSITIWPDQPWMAAATDAQPFAHWAERYLLMAVVGSGDPISAKDQLRALAILAIDAAEGLAGWHWVDVGAIGIRDHEGIEYLAAPIRVIYSAKE